VDVTEAKAVTIDGTAIAGLEEVKSATLFTVNYLGNDKSFDKNAKQ